MKPSPQPNSPQPAVQPAMKATPRRWQSALYLGLARVEAWKLEHEGKMAKEQMVVELRALLMRVPPEVLAMMRQSDPQGFEEMMKLVKGVA